MAGAASPFRGRAVGRFPLALPVGDEHLLCHHAERECGISPSTVAIESKTWFRSLVGEPIDRSLGTLRYYLSLRFWTLDKKPRAMKGWGTEGDKRASPKRVRGGRSGADSDVTAARRFRSPAPERKNSPLFGAGIYPDRGSRCASRLLCRHLRPSRARDHGHRLVGPGGGRAGSGSRVEDRAAQSLLNKLIRSNLVDNTNQVEVLQRDPNSPLYSVKSFEELRLKPQLLQGVYAMGFNRPSKIQENALPLMLAEPYVS
ncbi:ATP-dependent RNA helicase DDX19A [Pontoporia blainvillei]|uniref:RNA helicase n=1 Tax=Pontoporia blainvillei TaxID=48723 RepID=A0ABX0S4Q6_PONBL|nr:ATP-dependent RNA helicase DDX19A [Pontoporia blainvillei]